MRPDGKIMYTSTHEEHQLEECPIENIKFLNCEFRKTWIYNLYLHLPRCKYSVIPSTIIALLQLWKNLYTSFQKKKLLVRLLFMIASQRGEIRIFVVYWWIVEAVNVFLYIFYPTNNNIAYFKVSKCNYCFIMDAGMAIYLDNK